MTQILRITLAQLNPTVGDLQGNAAKARKAHQAAYAADSDLLALPEMFITGYPPQDLILRPAFATQAMDTIAALARDCAHGPAIAIGGPLTEGPDLFNTWFILKGGKISARLRKHHLPRQNLFDEIRLFDSGEVSPPYEVAGVMLGSPICEDIWHDDVAETLRDAGAEVLLVPNGSSYYHGKHDQRLQAAREQVRNTGLPLIYLNLVGGQDEQVHDGASFGMNPDGSVAFQLAAFEETVTHIDLQTGPQGWHIVPGTTAGLPCALEQDYHAICLGLGDYLRKSGFSKVVLGLSGGLDSALAAAFAVDVLGAENVRCVMLPSEYTSPESLDDAAAVAGMLGCRLDSVSIQSARGTVQQALGEVMAGTAPDITEENIQSRLRGVMLMAISNKFGEMLLTTGNKSELAVGYCTIYGDMCGGYNPLKDLYKSRVFDISRWRNENWRAWMQGPQGKVMPDRVIDKPPSAELRPDQADSDSLPPYSVLDPILEGLIEQDLSLDALENQGFDPQLLQRVERLILLGEWKRHQSAPGPRITPRAFGPGRRYPITNRWRERG